MIVHFESPSAFAIAANNIPVHSRKERQSFSGQTWEEASRGCYSGDDTLVADAERLLESFSTPIEMPKPSWRLHVTGCRPDVGAALSGVPECMWEKIDEYSDTAPIRVFVSNAASASIHHSKLAKRGIAAVALVMALQQLRAVELYIFGELQGFGASREDGLDNGACLQLVRIGAAPLDLATVSHMLTSQGVMRGMFFAHARHIANFNGRWAFGTHRINDLTDPNSAHRKRIAKCLDLTEHDLVIPPLFDGDELTDKPVEFIQQAVDRFLALDPMHRQ